jgi:uncharacterized protein
MLGRELPELRISMLPTPGAIVSVKGYATGQFDGYCGSDVACYEMANDTARFKSFFTRPLPWDVRAARARLQVLGVKHEYFEVDLQSVGSLLDRANIKGFIVNNQRAGVDGTVDHRDRDQPRLGRSQPTDEEHP